VISKIAEFIRRKNYRITTHAVQKMAECNVQVHEVEEAILSGELIEEYPRDKYSPSGLIFGRTLKNRPIHIVCSLPPKVWIITVYEPDPREWINLKIRRGEVK
jgi:hypothetical protein